MKKNRYLINGLYAITPNQSQRWPWEKILESCHAALKGGVSLLQMRQKGLSEVDFKSKALQLGVLCQHYQATLILNDPPAVSELSSWPGVTGVHLGQDDLPVAVARKIWGESLLIGASCYNRIDLAKQAVIDGADYLAFGALYPSLTKPDAVVAPLSLFQEAASLRVPAVAIGGVQLCHLNELVAAGVNAVAVISALFENEADPSQVELQARRWVVAWEHLQKESVKI